MASMANWFCAEPTNITPGQESAAKKTVIALAKILVFVSFLRQPYLSYRPILPLHSSEHLGIVRDLTQNRLRRGVFRDVEELIMAIGDYIDREGRPWEAGFASPEAFQRPLPKKKTAPS